VNFIAAYIARNGAGTKREDAGVDNAPSSFDELGVKTQLPIASS